MSVDDQLRRRIGEFDRKAILFASRLRRRPLTLLMRGLTRLGDASSILLISLLLVCWRREWLVDGLRVGAAALLAGVAAQGLKRLFGRERPSVGIENFESIAGNPDRFSFPSGHSATAFAIAAVLLGSTGAIGVVAPFVAIAIAASRVYLGAHYPFDVLVGSGLGILVGFAVRAASVFLQLS